jgi:hypothetical protein
MPDKEEKKSKKKKGKKKCGRRRLINITSSSLPHHHPHLIISSYPPLAARHCERRAAPLPRRPQYRLLTPRGPLQEIEEEEAQRAQGQAVDRKGALAQEEPRGAPQPCAVLAH